MICPDKGNDLFLLGPGGNPEWRGGCWLWCSGPESAAGPSRQVVVTGRCQESNSEC